MSVHYKFKTALEYDTVTFDGLHISVKDLKNAIVQQKRIGKNTDFDLQVTNAQTKEVYDDGNALIPKNTSLLIARIPNSIQTKNKQWEGYGGDATPPTKLDEGGPIAKAVDLSNLDAPEEDKIKAMMSQSTQDYDPSNYMKIRGANQMGVVPANYRCYKCHQMGHWIKDCPLSKGPEPIEIKKSTGIPLSFMVPVEGPLVPGAMMTQNGSYAVPLLDHQTYTQKQTAPAPPIQEQKTEIPEDLLCSICSDLLIDAVMIPCCGNSFCDECIRSFLLDSEDHECPDCHEKDISPDTLIPNRFLRNSVSNFKNTTGYVKKAIYRPARILQEANRIKAAPSPSSLDTKIEMEEKTVISEADSTEHSKNEEKDLKEAPKVELEPQSDAPPGVSPPETPKETSKRPKDQKAASRNHSPSRRVHRSRKSPYAELSGRSGAEDRPGTPTVDEPGMGGSGSSAYPPQQPQQQQQEVRPPYGASGGAMPPIIAVAPPMAGPPPVIPPGYAPNQQAPLGGFPPTNGPPPNFRLPPPGAAPPPYMQQGYGMPPRAIFDASRPPLPGPPPPSSMYAQNYPPNPRPHRDYPVGDRRVRGRTPSGVIDDPLAAFNRMLREKDERERRKRQKRSYSRSRSRSRSYSRSPRRMRSRSPRRRLSRSRSRSFSISRSRSRSFSGSMRGGSPFRDFSPRHSPRRRPPSRYRSPPPLRSPPRHRFKEGAHVGERFRDRDHDDHRGERDRDRDYDYGRDDRGYSRERDRDRDREREREHRREPRDERDHHHQPHHHGRREKEGGREGRDGGNRNYGGYFDAYEERAGRPKGNQWGGGASGMAPSGRGPPPPPANHPGAYFQPPPPEMQQQHGFPPNRYHPPRDYHHPPFMGQKEPPHQQHHQHGVAMLPNPPPMMMPPSRRFDDIAPPGVELEPPVPGMEPTPRFDPRFDQPQPPVHPIGPNDRFDTKKTDEKREKSAAVSKERREKRSRSPNIHVDKRKRSATPKKKSKSRDKDVTSDRHKKKRRDQSSDNAKERDGAKKRSSVDEEKKKSKEKKKKRDKKESDKKKKKDKKEKHREKRHSKDENKEENLEIPAKEEEENPEPIIKEVIEQERSPLPEAPEEQFSPPPNIDLYDEGVDGVIDREVVANYVKPPEDVAEEPAVNPDYEDYSVLEIHTTDIDLKTDLDVKNELAHLIPEKSKWEVEEDASQLSPNNESSLSGDSKDKSGKVTNEVLKRAENAIFAKAINAIRPIEIKKISTDRVKLYSGEKDLEQDEEDEKSLEIGEKFEQIAEDCKLDEMAKNPDAPVINTAQIQAQPRIPVKDRLGVKVDDAERIVKIDRRSRSSSPPRRAGDRRVELIERRRFDDRNRNRNRDRDRNRRDYRRDDFPRRDRHEKAEPARRRDERSVRDRSKSKTRKNEPDLKRETKRKRTRSPSVVDDKKEKRSKKKDGKKVKKEKTTKKHSGKEEEEQAQTKKTKNEDDGEKAKVVSEKADQKRKPTIDEANFEPDYDLESESDKDDKKDNGKAAVVNKVEEVKASKVVSSTSDSSASSSDSDKKRKKRKKHHRKRKSKRETSSSSSESDSDSSDEDRDKKRKKHKKKQKKRKKSKHK